jgi:hypothetical protein
MHWNILCGLLIATLLCACGGGEMDLKETPLASISDVSKANWQQLGGKRILFGHQSVGNNIIGGIESIVKENTQIQLNVIEMEKLEDVQNPAFCHFKVGRNLDPISKNITFSAVLDDGLGQQVDIAFYKYCYIDIREDAKVEDLFSSYRENMKNLVNKYPDVKFVHVTVPLTVVQMGPRAWVKKLLGKKIGGYDDNVKRNEFNTLMRNEYKGKESIFDLALIESTYPDGRRMTFKKKGETYFSLVPEYARDGRHLNEKGSKFVAEQLLILLAGLEG